MKRLTPLQELLRRMKKGGISFETATKGLKPEFLELAKKTWEEYTPRNTRKA